MQDQDKFVLMIFEQSQQYLAKLVKYLMQFRNINEQQAWDIVFDKFIPDIQGFLKKQFMQVYVEKKFLNEHFDFYNRDIRLKENAHQQNIFYEYYEILEKIKNNIFVKMHLTQAQIFNIIVQFLNMFYIIVMRMYNEFHDSIIEGGQFTVINNQMFNQFQKVFEEIKVDSTFSGLKRYKKVNMSKIKVKLNRIIDFKVWEIQLIYDAYLTFYTNFKSVTKILFPKPNELFKNQYVMKLIYLYLNHDFGYHIYNILCSDQFIQVLCELLKIFNSDKKQYIVPY